MTQEVHEDYEARSCKEYLARREENLHALRYARTKEEVRAIEDLMVEDCAAHFRISNEDRQALHEAVHEEVVIQRWMWKWVAPLLISPLVVAAVFAVVFTGKRRAWAWSGLVLAVGSAAILAAYLTGSLPV